MTTTTIAIQVEILAQVSVKLDGVSKMWNFQTKEFAVFTETDDEKTLMTLDQIKDEVSLISEFLQRSIFKDLKVDPTYRINPDVGDLIEGLSVDGGTQSG